MRVSSVFCFLLEVASSLPLRSSMLALLPKVAPLKVENLLEDLFLFANCRSLCNSMAWATGSLKLSTSIRSTTLAPCTAVYVTHFPPTHSAGAPTKYSCMRSQKASVILPSASRFSELPDSNRIASPLASQRRLPSSAAALFASSLSRSALRARRRLISLFGLGADSSYSDSNSSCTCCSENSASGTSGSKDSTRKAAGSDRSFMRRTSCATASGGVFGASVDAVVTQAEGLVKSSR
mmetsp:Transcript_41561/g.69127  ORF Transcript_41561/g.69127 Transcript_41561/m.69127 type:complete len:237 (-) Transcript_41561:1520-2230(-)